MNKMYCKVCKLDIVDGVNCKHFWCPCCESIGNCYEWCLTRVEDVISKGECNVDSMEIIEVR